MKRGTRFALIADSSPNSSIPPFTPRCSSRAKAAKTLGTHVLRTLLARAAAAQATERLNRGAA
jgi:hypothetical protein